MLIEAVALGVATIILALARSHANWRARTKGCRTPPSRRGWPLLGNLLDLAAVLGTEWEAYVEWGKELGSDIIYIKGMGQSIVVLNSKEAADALLDKKSLIYSSRPKLNMVHHMGWDWVLPLMPYGDAWRVRRKLFHQHFNPNDNELHRERTSQFLRHALRSMLQRPSDIQTINKDFVSGVMFSLAYGIDINEEPHYLAMCEDAIRPLVHASVPGRYMIDFIPWLKYVPEWMPGASFQRDATAWRQLQATFKQVPFFDALKRMASDSEDVPPSFVSIAMGEDYDGDGKSDHAVAVQEAAAMFYAAGSETTISVLDFLFLALVLHPDVQRKAQRELDDLLVAEDGHIRLPEANDAAQVPYLRAIVKEVLRWQPVTPIGVPHVSTADDIYQNYFIPEGSIVISNMWAMLRNEDLYPEQDAFKPERFLNEDGSFTASVLDPEEVAFGFGRRICLGRHIALSTLFITASTVLLLFDVCKSTDENGEDIIPQLDATCGLARGPKPFKCTLKPRSTAAVALIESFKADN